MTLSKHLLVLVLLLSTCCSPIAGQSGKDTQTEGAPCNTPPPSGFERDANIFTEQQEEWLGELLAIQVEQDFHIIADPEGGYLQKLGERLLAQLPPSAIHYRFTIVDMPENNSFGIPGGHIYISRRIIALAKNEDELAGLLGHEIGHIITRQPAIDVTRDLQAVLGVSRLGDRKDVIEKWNQLLDSYATKPQKYSEKREDAEQIVADRIALYAMSRAGYQPSRYVEFYDRLAQTKSNKGSFWTDLFGRTSRDSKRLRELLRSAASLSQGCVSSQAAGAPQHFLQWQGAVVGSVFATAEEALPGLVSKSSLNPPLRSDLRSVSFSPDGKYLLAQDESSIFVLTSNPTTLAFSLEAPDSYLAHFTPDSHYVVFYDKEYRVQKWDVQTGLRASIHELVLLKPCLQTALSPSGDVLACLTVQLEPGLIDVKSNDLIFQAKHLPDPTPGEAMRWLVTLLSGNRSDFIGMEFSPDDRYFVAGYQGSAYAYDLKSRSEVLLPRQTKELVSPTFTFLSSDEIVGYSLRDSRPAIVRVRFLSGEVLDFMAWSFGGKLMAPGKGDYVLQGQGAAPGVALLDWKAKKFALMSKTRAFAVFDDMFAGETRGGDIGVYRISDKTYQSGLDLPNGPLGTITAATFSQDGKWLALSGKSRGAVWNTGTGERTFLTRGYDGAFFDKDQLFARFPKQGNEAAAVFKMDTASKSLQPAYTLSEEDKLREWQFPSSIQQFGELLVKTSWESDKKSGASLLLEAFDVRTNTKLWQRPLERKTPGLFYSRAGHTLTLVVANYDDMKAEAKKYEDLHARLEQLGNETRRQASYIIEVLDFSSGKDKGRILVDSGNLSFKVLAALAVGDTLLVSDSVNRTLVYSLATGRQTGKVFGYVRAVSADGYRIFVENGKGNVDLYDLPGLQSSAHFGFPSRIAHAEFSADGSSVFVLTVEQAVYRLQMPPPANTALR